MVFSNTTNLNGIIQVFERKTGQGYGTVSGDTTLLKEATAVANEKSSRIWHSIFEYSGNWQYDDSNNTDLPEATTNLVNSQSDYALPSEALVIQRLEAKDENGQWFRLDPFIKEAIPSSLEEFYDEDGTPRFYRVVGDTLTLYPAPNYASTNGLKIYFDREAETFSTSDTTKTPGFASPYHQILPIKMSIDWYETNQPNSQTLQTLYLEEQKIERDLKKYYSKRFEDKPNRIGRAKRCFK